MKLINENINHKFERNKSGKIDSLGIGKISLIKIWLNDHEIENYIINDDFSIDVMGSVDLQFQNISEIPLYIQFGNIRGNFKLGRSSMKTLKGLPRWVQLNVRIFNDNLSSLKYAPDEIDGVFSIVFYNDIDKLEWSPKFIYKLQIKMPKNDIIEKELKFLHKNGQIKNLEITYI
jgi:hypothetical protein